MLAELRNARAENHADRFRRRPFAQVQQQHLRCLNLAALARELELKGLDADPRARRSCTGRAWRRSSRVPPAALKNLRHG